MLCFRQDEFLKFDIIPGEGLNKNVLNKKTEVKEEEIEIEIPSKCVIYEKIIYIAAKIVHIDFEGRSDGESLKQIVLALKPRRLILIRGNPMSTKVVLNFAKVFTDCAVYSPNIGQCMNVTSESHIYQVKN